MNKEQLLQRIEINLEVMAGQPVIRGTRLTVQFILGLLANGSRVQEILDEYRGVTGEDIKACLLFGGTSLGLHPDFPNRAIAIVEQCPGDTARRRYDPASRQFLPTADGYMYTARGYQGAYGWIEGLGTPPQPHVDILILTEAAGIQHGDVLEVTVCGIFWRADGDHKLVGVAPDLLSRYPAPDWSSLPENWRTQLQAIYPRLEPGEGWFGADKAREYLQATN